MKRIACLSALTLILGSVLNADWKIVTRTGNTTLTEYFKGSLIRTESTPNYITVLDYEHRRQVNWRSDLRQFMIVEWPPEVKSDPSSTQVITIERNTTDTGERKQFFGRTARHLVTRMTRSDGPETVMDGWYIDVPGLPKWKGGGGGSFAILTTIAAGGQRPGPPRIELKQTGPPPEGLPVRQKITTTVNLPGGKQQNYETLSEVTDLVEAPLADKFFEPPAGYQRVTNLPYPADRAVAHTWGELLHAHWLMVEDWFANLFR